MENESFVQARRAARQVRAAIPDGDPQNIAAATEVPPSVVDYIFKLQVKKEKEGPMKYQRYAEEMWRDATGEESSEQDASFAAFKNHLIGGLHDIDMSQPEYRYEDVDQSIGQLLETYGDSVRSVVLWSTGDVSATGYQVAKIDRSNIVYDFHQALKKQNEKRDAQQFLREKTVFMVADNKFDRMTDYVLDLVQKGERVIAITIIEDSANNFSKAEQKMRELMAAHPDVHITINPIWAVYSREGIGAKRTAEATDTAPEFERKKKSLNAIESFAELVDVERFESMFRDAYVFVDFDGVLGNNIEMRKMQAKIIYAALLTGVSDHYRCSQKEAEEKVLAALGRITS